MDRNHIILDDIETAQKEYVIHLDQNVLDTDNSFIPFVSNHEKTSSVSSQYVRYRGMTPKTTQKVNIFLERSSITRNVSRHYLQ